MNLHVFFLPFLAPGHMIPMVSLARLFADRGIKSTVVTTAGNVPRIQPTIEYYNSVFDSHKPHIELLTVPFPSSVPDNVSALPTPDLTPEFSAAISDLRQPFAELLESHRPDCIISDVFYPWTTDLGYPRIMFHGSSFFTSVVPGVITNQKLHESVTGDDEPFVVSGLPHRIEMTRSQLPGFVTGSFESLIPGIFESHWKSYGTVMNTFYELEPEYADIMKRVPYVKTWHVGPVSLSGRYNVDRGNEAEVESGLIRSWLDSKNTGSILYVCFGSLGKFTTPQLQEIASGLEDSGNPFIWVVSQNLQEEKVAMVGKGIVINGWAPQMMILNHQAVGGFMTHCGWNSCLEGASAGLPMITWPMFGDQFFNERLMVDVVGLGIGIGAKVCSANEKERTVVKREDVTNAVRGLMGGGEVAEGWRKRAREVGEKARRAVNEGGSSDTEMDRLVDDLISLKTDGDGSPNRLD